MPSSPPSQLFLIRIWHEPRTEEGASVRIRVRHVLSGETYYFREWGKVAAYLMAKLEDEDAPASEHEMSGDEER